MKFENAQFSSSGIFQPGRLYVISYYTGSSVKNTTINQIKWYKKPNEIDGTGVILFQCAATKQNQKSSRFVFVKSENRYGEISSIFEHEADGKVTTWFQVSFFAIVKIFSIIRKHRNCLWNYTFFMRQFSTHMALKVSQILPIFWPKTFLLGSQFLTFAKNIGLRWVKSS